MGISKRFVVGKTYKMSNYDVIFVAAIDGDNILVQTKGMTCGKWPGKGDISDYDDITKAFTKEWNGIISSFRLPAKEEAKDENVWQALKEAANNYSLFGASYSYAWLGTVYGSYNAWCVYSGGNVVNHGNQSCSYVVAPAFVLDLSKIILDGDRIIRADDHIESRMADSDDAKYEALKKELFMRGTEAISAFLSYAYTNEALSDLEKDTIENLMDDTYSQMPDDVFDEMCEYYLKDNKNVSCDKNKEARYTIQITYSWGDEEPPYNEFVSEEQAFAKACELAGREAYFSNEEFDENKSVTIYVDSGNKRIDLHYNWDNTWCYYRVVPIE